MCCCLWVTLVTVLAAGSGPAPACRLSEYFCDNGRCVPLNKYCDAINDCGDSTDEPRGCTPCNRTYYGDVGKTYELELHRPREDRMPFICHLKFSAGGGDLGDLVQLTFDSFTLGRFVSFTSEGCPDGALQIWETDRPHVGGSWCGTSWGSAIYYSETRTVGVSMKLSKLARDQTGYNFDYRMSYKMLPMDAAVVRYGGGVVETNDVANRNTSTNESRASYFLGDLMAGTYCSRIFNDCDKKVCRLQSPNFPGVYPRNLTCYYAVRQHEVPPGKQALIAVRQPKGQLVAIRSQSALYSSNTANTGTSGGTSTNQQHSTRELKVWSECDDVQDYVTVYDGYTTRDPVLLKFCGGGEAVPEAVSSGPELLVEFTSSPYGTFLYPASLHSLHGFQLEVEVRFVDIKSPSYTQNKRCEFLIRGTGKGTLETPQHSLPRNTTCLYYLQGVDNSSMQQYPDMFFWRRGGLPFHVPRYKVWLSVLKFHVTAFGDPQEQEEGCASHLKVWDGALRSAPNVKCNDIFCEEDKEKGRFTRPSISGGAPGKHQSNVTLLARYCKDQIPRSCDHSLLGNSTRLPRPCSLSESFLSFGDSLTLEFHVTESTALRPVTFRALYEFVDLHQDGEQFGTGRCSRKFGSFPHGTEPQGAQKFQSPKDVFLFGRGGASNLTCIYRFEAQKGERVKLTINSLRTGGRPCYSEPKTDLLGRLHCHQNVTAFVKIFEVPWTDVPPLPRDCLCQGEHENILPFVYISTSNTVELRFQVTNMTATDDFRYLNFEATWEFIRSPICTRKQRLSGPSGEISFRSPSRTPDEVNCENHPWLIEPGPGRYLYVKLRGISLQQQSWSQVDANATANAIPPVCGTRNRIAVHSGGSIHVVVCPQPPHHQSHHMVEVFSEGWVISSTRLIHEPILPSIFDPEEHRAVQQSRSVIVEFLAIEAGAYTLTWLEIARRRSVPPPAGFIMDDCLYRCPELDACINASLWCDGIPHCPSEFDEAAIHCSFLLQIPLLYLALGAAIILALVCIVCTVVFRSCRRTRRSKLQRRIKSLGPEATATLVRGGKEVIC